MDSAQPKTRNIGNQWINWMSSPKLVFWALPYLMFILVIGTLAQKWIGLHAALDIYFYSWVLWIGVVPLPGGLPVMAVIFINMCAKFLWFSPWTKTKIGSNIVHLGVIILIAGGIVSALTRSDTVMVVPEGASVSHSQSYDMADFVIARDDDVIARYPYEIINEGDLLQNVDLPFAVRVLQTCLHCDIILRPEAEQEGWIGPSASMKLIDKAPSAKPEENLQGISFAIEMDGKRQAKNLTFESFPKPPQFKLQDSTYTLYVLRRPHDLPFTLTLSDFRKIDYPGLRKAQAYESDIVITHGERSFPESIYMNNPLRYEGYTLYQSSFFTDHNGTENSVFTVVENKGRMFPYVSCVIIFIGLLLHVFIRIGRSGERYAQKKTPRGASIFIVALLCGLIAQGIFAPSARASINDLKPPAQAFDVGDSYFALFPILHDGRIKTMDSFARYHLQRFSGKEKIEHNDEVLTAPEWMADVIFAPDSASDINVFLIDNHDVLHMLGLRAEKGKRLFSYNDIREGLLKTAPRVDTLLKSLRADSANKPQEDGELLLALHEHALIYLQLTQSLSALTPLNNTISTETLQLYFSDETLKRGFITYMDLKSAISRIEKDVQSIMREHGGDLKLFSAREAELYALSMRFASLNDVAAPNNILRVFPVSAEILDESVRLELLFAPWATIRNGYIDSSNMKFLDKWISLNIAYNLELQNTFSRLSYTLYEHSIEHIAERSGMETSALHNKLRFENAYNKAAPFYKALYLVIIAAIIFIVITIADSTKGYSAQPRKNRHNLVQKVLLGAGFSAVIIAIVLMLAGTGVRVWIMDRPPVGTLYESVLFVALVLLGCLTVLTIRTKQYGVMAAGLIVCALMLLQAVVLGHAQDDFKVLDAVLNTNFWLATHVLFVTIGYGWCFLTAAAAHWFLLQACLFRDKSATILRYGSPEIRLITMNALIAFFFVTVGTILGGIWADQSWGRFWGWDPKENGALLIVLWIAWLLHGKISRDIKPLFYVAFMAFLSVIVAVAWFGVNLLSIGLHSYGFTSETAISLGSFAAAEIIIIGAMAIYLQYRDRKAASL